MEVVVRSATIMSIVCLDSLCMHSLCFYLFILFRPRLSLAPSSSNTTSGLSGSCKVSPVRNSLYMEIADALEAPNRCGIAM